MRSLASVKSEKGFSLIELMIVVAIIGILAAIAVPNFQRFQAKSRTAEAKSNLAALYTSEKGFEAEWLQFYGDFNAIGYRPEGVMRYETGFADGEAGVGPANHPNAAYASAAPTTVNTADGWCSADPTALTNGCAVLRGAMALSAELAAAVIDNAADPKTFIAGAAGDIDGNVADFDVWTIDQSKVVAQTSDDAL